jgi:signal transduction histidine kinase
MQNPSLDSGDRGLLSVFRLFVLIRLLFSIFTALSGLTGEFRISRLDTIPSLGIIESLLLLGYLSWPWLNKKLGKTYLPIALVIATIAPIVENFWGVGQHVTEESNMFRAMAGQWQVIILLIIPIILISWRYNLKIVIGYCLFLAVIDSLLPILIWKAETPRDWFPFSIVFFRTIMFIFVGYIVHRLAVDERQQNERLSQANRQLASSANTLEQLTISRERNRMARELHDTLSHSLSAVAVQLEAVSALWDSDQVKARAMLDQSLVMTRDGLNEARRAIGALRTAPLEDLGLALSLRNLATSEAERGGYSVEIHIPDESPRLKPEVEHCFYRIAEETLRNITRHAEAQHVTVSLIQAGAHVEMVFHDDGCGFTDNAGLQSDHFGLRGMRERAEAIGAQLSVDSRPGQGTTVRLQVEVNDDPGSDL